MTDEVEILVIGAGVVGLAVARRLARAGREVAIIERATAIGTGTSARNSGVIHAGIYYPAGSLKARLCVEGRARLYDYCTTRHIGHRRKGKLIVATEEAELDKLATLARQGARNGVDDLARLDTAAARALEPELRTVGALLSPSTGIVDVPALLLALLGEAQAAGAMLALDTELVSIEPAGDALLLGFADVQAPALRARHVINAAGLDAPAIARSGWTGKGGAPPTALFAKGSYFALTGRSPFSRLIYPVPVSGGLGIHLTLDLAGQARFGPDVEWVDTRDLAVDPARAADFYPAIRRYWPGLPDGALVPDYAGIRPKLAGHDDFTIHREGRLLSLLGVESPGVTAALALAGMVETMIAD